MRSSVEALLASQRTQAVALRRDVPTSAQFLALSGVLREPVRSQIVFRSFLRSAPGLRLLRRSDDMTKESTWVPSPTENSNNPEKKIEEDKTKDTQDVESETGQSEMSETVYIQVSSLNETLQKQTETLKVLAETMKEIRADLKNQQQRTESMTSSFLEFARDQTKCQDANAVQS
ncbi:hypothetical protein TKK_0000168 [Trichogramma kaykai]